MNHKQIANLVASVIQVDRSEKVRALRLYVEKTAGVRVEDVSEKELSKAIADKLNEANVIVSEIEYEKAQDEE